MIEFQFPKNKMPLNSVYSAGLESTHFCLGILWLKWIKESIKKIIINFQPKM